MTTRPVSVVPAGIHVLAVAALITQLCWHHFQPPSPARARVLPQPPAADYLRVAGFGDPVALSRILILWLQAFDNQPGVSIPFRHLDYSRVEQWLERILEIDPRGQYALMAASRLYGEVPDETRQRQMLEFVYRKFLEKPDLRWRWLAHAAVIAEHKLGDLPLALKYARALATNIVDADVPHWVRQMEIFILEDLGEVQAARSLIGGLLASGTVREPREINFLRGRLKSLERGSGAMSLHRDIR